MAHSGVTMPVTIANCLLTQKPQVQGMRHNSLPDPVKHLLKVCAAVSMLLVDCQIVSDSQDLVSSIVKSANPCLMWRLSESSFSGIGYIPTTCRYCHNRGNRLVMWFCAADAAYVQDTRTSKAATMACRTKRLAIGHIRCHVGCQCPWCRSPLPGGFDTPAGGTPEILSWGQCAARWCIHGSQFPRVECYDLVEQLNWECMWPGRSNQAHQPCHISRSTFSSPKLFCVNSITCWSVMKVPCLGLRNSTSILSATWLLACHGPELCLISI